MQAYGFQNIQILSTEVEDCIAEDQTIRQEIYNLWVTLECEHSVRESSTLLEHFPDYQSLIQLLQSSEFNWFEFIDRVERVWWGMLVPMRSNWNTIDNDMLRLSYEAYVASKHELSAENRTARCINGEIISETESDNPTYYISTPSTSTSALVEKKRKAIQRRARR